MKYSVFLGTVLSIGVGAVVCSGFMDPSLWETNAFLGVFGRVGAAHADAHGPSIPAGRDVESINDRSEALTEVYPRARWRLANMDDLADVMLWVSHILIRHEDVVPGQLSFQRSHWKSAPEAPARSRRAAFELARDIERRLRARPKEFDEIARTTSEDVATREQGGSLGGVAAIYLRPWPEVLDALATLGNGEMSRVVETEFGFHIFLRRPAPSEHRVSGARIIIGHADTSWLETSVSGRPVIRRSRREALELARTIFDEAQAHPDRFASLVRKYSEHSDLIREGDFGEWSTREPTPFAAAIEVLQRLEVGDVAPPMDSLFGYQIIQRTPNRPRRKYAMLSLNVPFDPAQPDVNEASRTSARRRAEAMLRDVRTDASRFASYHERYCCSAVEQWVEGRGSALIEHALAELQPGDVAADLVDEEGSYVIVQRVAAGATTATQAVFDLPSPARPDMEWVVSRLHGLRQLSQVREKAAAVLDLDSERASRFTWLHDVDRIDGESASASKSSIYEAIQRQTRDLLGREQYERYANVLYQHFEHFLLLP